MNHWCDISQWYVRPPVYRYKIANHNTISIIFIHRWAKFLLIDGNLVYIEDKKISHNKYCTISNKKYTATHTVKAVKYCVATITLKIITFISRYISIALFLFWYHKCLVWWRIRSVGKTNFITHRNNAIYLSIPMRSYFLYQISFTISRCFFFFLKKNMWYNYRIIRRYYVIGLILQQ